jgi:hypothetical protein
MRRPCGLVVSAQASFNERKRHRAWDMEGHLNDVVAFRLAFQQPHPRPAALAGAGGRGASASRWASTAS